MGVSFTTFFSNEETTATLSPECLEQAKIRDELFNQNIMADIISSFDLDIDNSYDKFTLREIEAAHLLFGGRENDTYILSLTKLFNEIPKSTRGTPRLFVRPENAYFLYKETTNTNVMVRLKLEYDSWVVVEEKKVSGKPIELEQLKCEKDFLKMKNNKMETTAS
ncbi:hypothetical protein H1D32_11425 [Anaerobacillus sp. CMMVII]|nr:hypothetical protein [Anaerobacillus sp. CMMVII]